MKFDEVVRGRRSMRGFLQKLVPKALIRAILELAMRAPTSLNTQPWNLCVVGGAVLDRIRQGNVVRNLPACRTRASSAWARATKARTASGRSASGATPDGVVQ
jgi:nitroreductase